MCRCVFTQIWKIPISFQITLKRKSCNKAWISKFFFPPRCSLHVNLPSTYFYPVSTVVASEGPLTLWFEWHKFHLVISVHFLHLCQYFTSFQTLFRVPVWISKEQKQKSTKITFNLRWINQLHINYDARICFWFVWISSFPTGRASCSLFLTIGEHAIWTCTVCLLCITTIAIVGIISD